MKESNRPLKENNNIYQYHTLLSDSYSDKISTLKLSEEKIKYTSNTIKSTKLRFSEQTQRIKTNTTLNKSKSKIIFYVPKQVARPINKKTLLPLPYPL